MSHLCVWLIHIRIFLTSRSKIILLETLKKLIRSLILSSIRFPPLRFMLSLRKKSILLQHIHLPFLFLHPYPRHPYLLHPYPFIHLYYLLHQSASRQPQMSCQSQLILNHLLMTILMKSWVINFRQASPQQTGATASHCVHPLLVNIHLRIIYFTFYYHLIGQLQGRSLSTVRNEY